MKLASYREDQVVRWGVVRGDGETGYEVVDATSVAPSLKAAIAQGRLASAELQVLSESEAGVSLDSVVLLPPILGPEKILCIGVNYRNRNAEYQDGSEEARNPSVFIRTPDSLTGHLQPLWRPPESHMLDYEGEIALIIGKEGRRIASKQALSHIAGLTLMNEGTLRDWVRHAKFNVTQGKNFVSSGSVGPWMVTADQFSVDDYLDMALTTRVNGEVRQHDTTANMMFPIARLIEYLSTFTCLKPGDVIAIGTPTGAGARMDPPQYLVPGDLVEVEVDGIGVLRNIVEDENTDAPV